MRSSAESTEVKAKQGLDAEVQDAVIAEQEARGLDDHSRKSTGLLLTFLDHDVRGEKYIAIAQSCISAFTLTLYYPGLPR
jgi:hypothetical protein